MKAFTKLQPINSDNIRWWRHVVQLIFGIGLVCGLVFALNFFLKLKEYQNLPPGWQIIRPPEDVRAIAIDRDVIWAGGRDGLVAVNRKTSKMLPETSKVPKLRYINDLYIDRNNNLWVGYRDGLVRRDPDNKWHTYPRLKEVFVGSVLSILEDNKGILWIGGENDIVYYTAQEFKVLKVPEKLMLPSIDVIFQARNGDMWFASGLPTSSGLLRYQNNQWQVYTIKNGLVHNSIHAIIQDRKGNLWFASGYSSRGGASCFFNNNWTSLSQKDGLAGEMIRSVYEDRQGNLWFGSEFDGISIYNGQGLQLITPKNGLAGWEVKEMLQDSNGIYWLGTENGLSRIESIDSKFNEEE